MPRDRVLDDAELRSVWKAADETGYGGDYVQFILLTAARRNEAADLQWDEIDGDVWTLPAERNKTRVPLARPLSKAALRIVAAQPQQGPFVFSFTGQRPVGYERATTAIRRRTETAHWTLHDLRRTSRTLLSRAGIAADVAERCLGHSVSLLRRTYDRHPYKQEMAHAYEALARQIELIVNPEDNVTPMRGRRRA